MNLSPSPVYARRIMGVETEYGLTAVAKDQSKHRQLGPDEVAREMFRPVVSRHGSSNIFTTNASRLYLDVGSHPEIATGECDSLSQLLAYERAGDLLVDAMAKETEEAFESQGEPRAVYLFKNNIDSAGNSYGCHENYLISRHMVLKDLGKALLPFLITRQLLCGAGCIAPAAGDKPARFLLSQRADHVWEGVSSATTRSRPIINTRDEPHGDSSRFRRMHIIVGDSNMAEPTFALKVGSTLLMLEMLEAEFELPAFDIEDPITHMKDIARDITGGTELQLKSGGSVTALDVQRALHSRAQMWLEHREDSGTPTSELARVVELWGKVVEAIETQDFSQVNKDIDWVIKRELLEAYRSRLGGDWAHPKLAQIDLTYHDIRPGRGLYDVLLQRGRINRWIKPSEAESAVDSPPATTRARLRGVFMSKAMETNAAVTVDWTRMKVNRPEPLVHEFNDPFIAESEKLDELLRYMDAHAE